MEDRGLRTSAGEQPSGRVGQVGEERSRRRRPPSCQDAKGEAKNYAAEAKDYVQGVAQQTKDYVEGAREYLGDAVQQARDKVTELT